MIRRYIFGRMLWITPMIIDPRHVVAQLCRMMLRRPLADTSFAIGSKVGQDDTRLRLTLKASFNIGTNGMR